MEDTKKSKKLSDLRGLYSAGGKKPANLRGSQVVKVRAQPRLSNVTFIKYRLCYE